MKVRLIHSIFLFLTTILLACQQDVKIPKDVIPKDKMIEVMTGIEVAQAIIKLQRGDQDSIISQKALFNDVYHKFNITQQQYNYSLNYYCQDPEGFENMCVTVISRLTKKQAAYQ